MADHYCVFRQKDSILCWDVDFDADTSNSTVCGLFPIFNLPDCRARRDGRVLCLSVAMVRRSVCLAFWYYIVWSKFVTVCTLVQVNATGCGGRGSLGARGEERGAVLRLLCLWE